MKLEQIHTEGTPDLIEQATRIIPSHLQGGWSGALQWHPKYRSWGWPIKKTVDAVAQARKPLVFGYRNDYIEENAGGLSLLYTKSDVAVACLRTNIPIAEVLIWAEDNLFGKSELAQVYHTIVGVCLGYPISDVVQFARKYQ